MKKKFMLITLWIVARIRLKLERRFFKRRSPKGWEELEELDNWRNAFSLDSDSFDYVINRLPYKSDAMQGFLDYSFPIDRPDYFFKNLPYGRDCDDWTRIWCAYCNYHNQVCEEWIVTTQRHPFKNSHFVAVVHEDEGYRLLDYHRWNLKPTVEDAVASVCDHWTIFDPENILAVKYKVWIPKKGE